MYFLIEADTIKCGDREKGIEDSVICELLILIVTKIKKDGLPNIGRSK